MTTARYRGAVGTAVHLTVQCAWCRKVRTARGRWVDQGEPVGNVTHGLCPECETELREELDALCGS